MKEIGKQIQKRVSWRLGERKTRVGKEIAIVFILQNSVSYGLRYRSKKQEKARIMSPYPMV